MTSGTLFLLLTVCAAMIVARTSPSTRERPPVATLVVATLLMGCLFAQLRWANALYDACSFIIGAAALIRQTSRREPPAGSWLARMLARKPRMLAITALANKMARMVWALLTRNEVYKAPAVNAA